MVIPEGNLLITVADLHARHGAVHDGHGQCLCRLPGDGGGDRRAAADRRASRQSGGGRRGRHAGRILRDADDADGGQLQSRPRRLARAEGSIWRDPRAGDDRAADCCCSTRSSSTWWRSGEARSQRWRSGSRGSRSAMWRSEYPHKLDHVLLDDGDARTPRDLHPIFFGSFDWHSCVHGWWTLLTLRRLFPDMARGDGDRRTRGASFTPDKIAAELAYLDRPMSAGFERPYGWAWLLALHWRGAATGAAGVRRFADRFKAYLAKLTYPITRRHAFQHRFRADAGDRLGATASTRRWRSRSAAGRRIASAASATIAAWEPGGRRIPVAGAVGGAADEPGAWRRDDFAAWFDAFLPDSRPVRAACTRVRPKRRQDRPSRRAQPQPRLGCWRSIARTDEPSRSCGARRAPPRRCHAAYFGRLYGRALAGDASRCSP